MLVQRTHMILWGFLLLTAGCSADPTPLSGSTVNAPCLGIDIPVETEISIAGVFEGGTFPDGQVRNSTAPTLVALKDAAVGAPQIYVVSATAPVVWDFADVPAARIRGVIAYGHHRQIVQNTPVGVPIAHGSYDASSKQNAASPTSAECSGSYSLYHGGPELDALVAEVEKGNGVKAARFRSAYAPTVLDFDDDQPGEAALVAPNRPAQSTRDRIDEDPTADDYPGFERLQPLIDQGLLRQATPADVRAWEASATTQLSTRDLAPYRAVELGISRTYVVLGPMTLPDASGGTFPRTFIVPKDVDAPAGARGFHRVYLIADGSCSAAPDC